MKALLITKADMKYILFAMKASITHPELTDRCFVYAKHTSKHAREIKPGDKVKMYTTIPGQNPVILQIVETKRVLTKVEILGTIRKVPRIKLIFKL